VDVFKSHVHGTNVDSQVFELCEEIVEVMRRKCELCWLDILRGEREVRA